MKTAISIDDHLLQAADKAAQRMGLSRSRLFSLALDTYLKKADQERMLEQLNRVYDSAQAGSPPLGAMKRKFARSVFARSIEDKW